MNIKNIKMKLSFILLVLCIACIQAGNIYVPENALASVSKGPVYEHPPDYLYEETYYPVYEVVDYKVKTYQTPVYKSKFYPAPGYQTPLYLYPTYNPSYY